MNDVKYTTINGIQCKRENQRKCDMKKLTAKGLTSSSAKGLVSKLLIVMGLNRDEKDQEERRKNG